MTKEKYFQTMNKMKEKIFTLMKQEILNNFSGDLLNNILLLIKKREDKIFVRPFIAKTSYELCGGKNWEKDIILPSLCLEMDS